MTETENTKREYAESGAPERMDRIRIQGAQPYIYRSGISAPERGEENRTPDAPGRPAARETPAAPRAAESRAPTSPDRPAARETSAAPGAAENRAPRTARAADFPARRTAHTPDGNRRSRFFSLLALIFSILALLLSCVSLVLQLRPEPAEEPAAAEDGQEEEILTIQYRNHSIEILENVPANVYDASLFRRDDAGFLRYLDAPVGIDVSSYQGEIDWNQVVDAGVKFAMIRLGLRGYTKGGVMADGMFEQNITGALDAGLDVGVYFFSQAVSVWEAEEEADYVLERLKGYRLTYPVVFDWESVNDPDARTNHISSAEVTLFAEAFCERVAAAGYAPTVYFNQDQGYLGYQLDRLTGFGFWLAEYNEHPGFYYDFDFWQYSERGSVPGIGGAVDLDLDLRAYSQRGK